jgi:hypothetical protein
VRIALDTKGFIRTLEVLAAAPSASNMWTRDQTIARPAVLKVASNFLGSMSQTHEEVHADDVLVLADRWLHLDRAGRESAEEWLQTCSAEWQPRPICV